MKLRAIRHRATHANAQCRQLTVGQIFARRFKRDQRQAFGRGSGCFHSSRPSCEISFVPIVSKVGDVNNALVIVDSQKLWGLWKIYLFAPARSHLMAARRNPPLQAAPLMARFFSVHGAGIMRMLIALTLGFTLSGCALGTTNLRNQCCL